MCTIALPPSVLCAISLLSPVLPVRVCVSGGGILDRGECGRTFFQVLESWDFPGLHSWEETLPTSASKECRERESGEWGYHVHHDRRDILENPLTYSLFTGKRMPTKGHP